MPGTRLVIAVLQLAEQVVLQLDRQRGLFIEATRRRGLVQLVRPDQEKVGRSGKDVGVRRATSSVSTDADGDEDSGFPSVNQLGHRRLAGPGLLRRSHGGTCRRKGPGQIEDLAPANRCR
jgi:hypothetical protein